MSAIRRRFTKSTSSSLSTSQDLPPSNSSPRRRPVRRIPKYITYPLLLLGSYFILRKLFFSSSHPPLPPPTPPSETELSTTLTEDLPSTDTQSQIAVSASGSLNDVVVGNWTEDGDGANAQKEEGELGGREEEEGHGDFEDDRNRLVDRSFLSPECEGCYWVNTMLGNGGPDPNLSGGMIPSVAPPFAMTRWTAQTRQNYVSMCPYNQSDTTIHGFIGTHQPAIWMGESGPSQISVGLGDVVTDFDKRGLPFRRQDEYASPNYYSNVLQAGANGKIEVEMSATSRVGHFRFTFDHANPSGSGSTPHVVIQASRASVITSDPSNITFPLGEVCIDQDRNEVYGWNDERQDRILLSEDIPAKGFKGYFVARFANKFTGHGVSYKGALLPNVKQGHGKDLAGYVTFDENVKVVEVRVGVSFISVEQARRNIDLEIPDDQSLEATSHFTRSDWASKLDALKVSGASSSNLTVLYTSLAHTLVYPYEISENAGTISEPSWSYYSGYLDSVQKGRSYSGYSIWDTFRAETAWLNLLAPERVGEMIQSMLADYVEGGWLPMWKNLVETNVMVGTHSDSIIAQAMESGIKGFDYNLAWQAVKKNAFVPPDRDSELIFADREQFTPQEARAGLTEYLKLGWVAADKHAEAGSRTLDYAYDDYAASIVASHAGATQEAMILRERSKNYRKIWNHDTGFMGTRRYDGSWAGNEALATGEWSGESAGWTEGDKWAYSFNVMHDIPGLIELVGGNASFVDFLDRHFQGGHNLHSNEPSHHVPYLYSYAGAAYKAQAKILEIAQDNYDETATGLSGNEDCGQMSAWYLFSAMGFYPVDPASATYVIGTPFFDGMSIHFPGAAGPLVIRAAGASSGKKYVKSVTIDGVLLGGIVIRHSQIKDGGEIVFEMSDTPTDWAS